MNNILDSSLTASTFQQRLIQAIQPIEKTRVGFETALQTLFQFAKIIGKLFENNSNWRPSPKITLECAAELPDGFFYNICIRDSMIKIDSPILFSVAIPVDRYPIIVYYGIEGDGKTYCNNQVEFEAALIKTVEHPDLQHRLIGLLTFFIGNVGTRST